MSFRCVAFKYGCLVAAALAFAAAPARRAAAISPLDSALPTSISRPLVVEAIAFGSTAPFAKWRAVLRRNDMRDDAALAPARIRSLVATLAGRGPAEQMAAVNVAFNSIPYREDRTNWGTEDYWASPAEFLTRGAGDCEDYAIAKYFTLRTLGFPAQRLYLLNYRDPEVGTHMVLVAETEDGAVVMDNRRSAIRPLAAYAPVKPLYAINETGAWWLTRAR